MEVSNYHVFKDPSLKHQTLFPLTPHVGAFPVCSPQNGESGAVHSTPGPLIKASKLENIGCKFLKGFSSKCVVPSRFDHGCCSGSIHGSKYQTSLLGPDFVDYEELAPYSNQELATIAKYGNKWAIVTKLLR
ncbi:hypothetical protein Tco_1198540, partial [Tanacetum coccineum]